MWHGEEKGLPNCWLLASASLSLGVLICKMGVQIKGNTPGVTGLHDQQLVLIFFVGGRACDANPT